MHINYNTVTGDISASMRLLLYVTETLIITLKVVDPKIISNLSTSFVSSVISSSSNSGSNSSRLNANLLYLSMLGCWIYTMLAYIKVVLVVVVAAVD